ncbi:exo-alpha-sialidase [Arthrobacter sp. STN4]|uniref:exo-alpha-sialidase n=1 Tax=Arthrobacter sp. STN4 TaxID=2923276 RepID=UPI00211A4770|nr:exo-alpha-sialidase [Arthrobacter sp. STN4]MCQ9162691.1 exo-alpha-sialidase [Arthrobacter sp. STN4]
MKSTDKLRRWKGWPRTTAAGVLGAGLLATMVSPAMAAVPAAPVPVPTPNYAEQVLASNGDNAIDPVLGKYYRIVALADLGKGVLLAAYDGRPDGGDSPSPNSIVQRRSTDGGKTWGAPSYIARGQVAAPGVLRYGFSDPSYVVDKETGTVFNFHVYSKDQGFAGSTFGNDDADRQVISTEVSVSTDGGLSWSTDPANMPSLPVPAGYPAGSAYSGFAGPLVTSVAKPAGATVNGVDNVGGVAGMFASSGEGIQLKYGQFKGRLIQQYAGKVRQADGSTQIQAYSVYSDDHGKTWQRGAFVGTGMDENKVVELSDGRVMLNSRDSSRGGGRKIAISTDGGASYGAVHYDSALVDPTNNAGLTRMFPDAAEGTRKAKVLLFSNSNSSTSRTNGTVRYSCDDGTTWSAGKQFKAGAMSYSTITALSDGSFGILYEGDSNTITFGKFNAGWVDAFCDAGLAAAPVTGNNGATVAASLTVTNTSAKAIDGATATFAPLPGWQFGSVQVPTIQAGGQAVVTVPVTIPSYAKAGSTSITAQATVLGHVLSASVPVTITGGATETIVGAAITGARNDAGRDLAADPYVAGDAVPYSFAVASTGNITEAVVPQSGNFAPFLPPGPGNCRYLSLPVWGSYNCTTPKHVVTAGEAAQGFFVPATTWQVTGTGAATQDYTITGDEVDLMVRNPRLTGTASMAWNDVDGNGFANPGDTVTTTATVTNAGNVPLTDVAAAGTASPVASLAPGESATFTSTRTVTAAELAAGQVAATSVAATGHNGARTAAVGLAAAALVLPVLPPKPASSPAVDRANLNGRPPVDLGLQGGKYSVGDTVTVHGAAAHQWSYLYLNQHGQRFGWFLADAHGTITFTVPDGTKNGQDTLVLLDKDGSQVSYGAFHVTP